MARVFVLFGNTGVGKDTIASYVDLTIVKFASMAKSLVAAACGVQPPKMEDKEWRKQPHDKLSGMSPLEALGHMYHETKDTVFHSMMVKAEVEKSRSYLAQGFDVAFTDIRNMDEALEVAQLAKEYDLILVEVLRPGYEKDIMGDEYQSLLTILFNHAKYAYYINNDSTLEQACANLDKIMEEV